MKRELDTDELNLVKLAQEYSSDDKARELLESLRWPKGPVCPHCKCDGTTKKIYTLTPKPDSSRPARKGLYKCGACRKQFTVTVGTIFEDSHIPIGKWLMALFIMCSSKKGISAHQVHRMLDVTYKSAWFMCHRIRYAMGPSMPLPPDKMLKGIVEADETFVGGVGDRKTKMSRKTPVVALIERGGDMQVRVVADVTQKNLGKCLAECVNTQAILCTDEHVSYKTEGKNFAKHHSVVHGRKQYAKTAPDGTLVHVNSCESFFSLLKRGVHGSWHHVSREHLAKYANEFAFRWNSRHDTDGERMSKAVAVTEGKRLTYRQAA